MHDTVLITGAAGRLGSVVGRGLDRAGVPVRLTDISLPPSDLARLPFYCADLTRPSQIEPLLEGVGAVVHMAGHPNSRDWAVVGTVNVEASWNVFDAAARSGVRTLVYASSTHVVGRHKADAMLRNHMPLAPDGPYGMSKAVGEMLLAEICRVHPIAGFALRIGACREDARCARELRNWLSHADLVRVVQSCLAHDVPGSQIVWALSNNRRAPIDRTDWVRIGYAPSDDAEFFEPALRAAGVDTSIVSEWPLLGGAAVIDVED